MKKPKTPGEATSEVTCECGERMTFHWCLEADPKDEEALCPGCESLVFRTPIRPTETIWLQIKDETPKCGQNVWLHCASMYAPDVRYSKYGGEPIWLLDSASHAVDPEDYWRPFVYPEPPSK